MRRRPRQNLYPAPFRDSIHPCLPNHMGLAVTRQRLFDVQYSDDSTLLTITLVTYSCYVWTSMATEVDAFILSLLVNNTQGIVAQPCLLWQRTPPIAAATECGVATRNIISYACVPVLIICPFFPLRFFQFCVCGVMQHGPSAVLCFALLRGMLRHITSVENKTNDYIGICSQPQIRMATYGINSCPQAYFLPALHGSCLGSG